MNGRAVGMRNYRLFRPYVLLPCLERREREREREGGREIERKR